jgi:L-ascorbate metabolism protein UlaG (beta-lactamase superfamily)
MPRVTASMLGTAIRSGLRRYPRELLGSLRVTAGLPRRGLEGTKLLRAWKRIEREEAALGVAWLGHCSVLLRLAGRTVLTDPVLSERIGVRVGSRTVGLKRQAAAPIEAERLAGVADVVLLSHAHFDHLDRPTLAKLADKRTVVVTAKRTRRLVPAGFGEVIELGWMEALEIAGLRIVALKPKHWGARAGWDVHRGYNAYMVQPMAGPDPSVLFAGDTADTEAFADLRGVELAIFGVGAYAPWEHAHATPEQVWRMFRGMGARQLLPVHHSTFDLGEEADGEPLARLRAAAGAEEGGRILELPMGGTARWAVGR